MTEQVEKQQQPAVLGPVGPELEKPEKAEPVPAVVLVAVPAKAGCSVGQ